MTTPTLSERLREAAMYCIQGDEPTLREAADRIEEMEKALREIVNGAPEERPERYEGDNHGDSENCGYKCARYYDAQLARAALGGKT